MNNLTESRRLAPEVRAAVAVFLKTYRRGDGPFAISEAIEAVRRTYPSMDVSDNDLTDAIAGEAVAAGLNIHFDGNGNPIPRPAVERWENEGGAIGKMPRTEAQRRIDNDTSGTRRRATETRDRNRLI